MKTFGPLDDSTSLRVVDSVLAPESYSKRDGYSPTFVDQRHELPLPKPGRLSSDLAPVTNSGNVASQNGFELKYTHFSVLQSKSRRMPICSAVNIDGEHRIPGVARTDIWRRDPRIALRYQNHRDAYGNQNQGLFSRGHMTRREDPNWGDQATAELADMDTFHVTNAAPQQQGFNAGVWLSLEDYVLENTDEADMRVSVLTGPILDDGDPEYFGIKVPVAFFKIVAFKHFRTKKLTTIGYKRSQSSYLSTKARSRFVFGDFDDTQVSIAGLAADTGLGLSEWQSHDVMAQAGANLEVRLQSASDLFLSR